MHNYNKIRMILRSLDKLSKKHNIQSNSKKARTLNIVKTNKKKA